ncbi:MAG: hypothetical protein ABR527_00370 [Gemmatimonadota bacterium]
MMRSIGLVALFVCSLGCGARDETLDRPTASEPPVIRVINRNWADMRVYLARDGARALLGFVTTGSTTTFPAPRDLTGAAGELRLVADPVGSALVFRSEPFRLDPGRVVEWTIRVRPAYSSIVVY